MLSDREVFGSTPVILCVVVMGGGVVEMSPYVKWFSPSVI